MYYYVYKITNLTNGKFYIGKRKHEDPYTDTYMGSGKLIVAAIKKHGKDLFTKEIIKIFENNDSAAELERSLVTTDLIESNTCYNMHEGGHGGFAHINNAAPLDRVNIKSLKKKCATGEIKIGGTQHWTEESYKKVIKQARLNNELGLTSGWHHSEETKNRLSEIGAGINNSHYGHVWCIPENANDCSERKSFSGDNIPPGWVPISMWRDIKKDKKNPAYGRHWYNDGSKNYYLYPSNTMVTKLIKGRILTNSLR